MGSMAEIYKRVAHLTMNLSGAVLDRKFYQELFIATQRVKRF